MTDIIGTIDISGLWNYALDKEDKGISEKWQDTALLNKGFKLPGTTSENCVGEALDMELVLSNDTVKRLRERYKYLGAAWYQRDITIPEEWKGKRIILFLERIMFQSRVWIDGNEVGCQDSLSTPHEYDLTDYILPGLNQKLTIRIDNRDVENIGISPSAYTDETQTIWNGIVGKMELRAVEPVYLKDVQIYPDTKNKKVKVKVTTANYLSSETNVKLSISSESANAVRRYSINSEIYEYKALIGSHETVFEYYMGEDVLFWDEFAPNLYNLKLSLTSVSGGSTYKAEKTVNFGMREFKTEGTQFVINNRKTFLRGTLDCCIYPLTGYPPTKEEEWTRIFNIVKDYGLNHVRFHSWCPPEAAFTAADRLGVYLQVEGPAWMDNWNCPVGKYPEHYSYLPVEAEKIMQSYANHPSFCIYSNGNELNGDFNLLHDIIVRLKEKDNRVIYTLTTNWDRHIDSADDLFIAQSVDGVGLRGQYYLNKMAETTELNYNDAVKLREVPIIVHEVGQYCVYPDMDEIEKYNGVLRAFNFEAIKNDLEGKNILSSAKKFTMGSGMLALQLYKDEIEAILRTKDIGGFQLLDIHDFPGQSTATVGILNSFWESKGLISPHEFRRFCNTTVLLLKTSKRIYETDEDFYGSIEAAHFGTEEIRNKNIGWKIINKNSDVLDEGLIYKENLESGSGIYIGDFSSSCFKNIKSALKLKVVLYMEGTNISNSWDIWVYPNYQAEKDLKVSEDVIIASKFDAEIERQLDLGKKVLLIPDESHISESYKGKFFPVFWSPVHFKSTDPCGIYCDNEHPIFNYFPTEYYSSYQWKKLLESSESVCLDSLPKDYEPIVQVIPNYFYNHRLANIFEAKIGRGSVIVCSINIVDDLEVRAEARQLRYSILNYMSGSDFNPRYELSPEQIQSIFKTE